MLRRIAYRSVRVPGMSEDELVNGLVIPAAERNRRAGVTGCLRTGDASFVQIIEGDARAVDGLMARIAVDRRHHTVHTIMNCAARFRLFNTWNLKWVNAGCCLEVETLADAIVERRPQDPPPARGEGTGEGTAERPSRMAQIVNALVSAQAELP